MGKADVVVVTGASAGIGAALAAELVGHGKRPVLLARNRARLDEVAARIGGESLVVEGDVCKREDLARAVEQAIARYGAVDAWVSNAGRGISCAALELTDDDIDAMMLVNFKSALYGAQAIVPHFRTRGRGHLIHVSSMLGRIPFVGVRAAYSASKAALDSLTANLRVDLRAENPALLVSAVHVGVVATDFGLNALHGGPDNRHIPGAQPVEEVARVIADLIDHPRSEVYSRPEYRQRVARYYAAEEVAEIEREFIPSRR
jgi:NAD(P)-dependent dehydrogenase (short-subunit alcohol dehydrogenase family)